ncbi:MAG: hypothetical protein H7A45_18030 [Verrucomicrobiales bacterium]|nr:hypothetical protein [Verrucomicrobiales bacterium]MCP5525462.1 hypothetical protein [Verrucomicrobiales bacterium]
MTAELPEQTSEAKGDANDWLSPAQGIRLPDATQGEPSPHALCWQGGSTNASMLKGRLFSWPRKELARLEGRIVGIAGCLGDWREEGITSLDGENRICSNPIPTSPRRIYLLAVTIQ